VITYNPARPRDRSHYEHFRAYHQNIYSYVEPTSITPFADPVIDRALHAVVIALIRMLGDQHIRSRPSPGPSNELLERGRRAILDRVAVVDARQLNNTARRLEEIIDEWRKVPPSKYGDFSPPDEEEPLMFPSGTERHPMWSPRPMPTPSSMRTWTPRATSG